MRTTGIKRLVAMTMAVCVLAGMMPQNVRAEEAAAQTEPAVSEETSTQETQSEETQPEETMTPETQESVTTVSGNEPTVEPSPEPSPTPAATEEPMAGMFQMPNIVRSGDQTPVSRIQWLKELTTTFDMTVEKDNYPDNYYSDIDSSYADYYTVMLATEFGLVDVEAGEAFEPDQAASREFAAHSLNLCMGYVNEDDYTFTDQSDAKYADDLQIAVKRGWLELADGKVLPKKALTAEEKDVMITDARDAVASTKIDPDYQNAYTFAEGVIVLPEGTVAELTGENELTLYSCDTELKAGDIFAVVQEDFPVVKKVISVATEEDKMIVQVESVATEEAFQDIDVEGSLSADLTQIQAFSDQVALTYIAGGTQEQNWEDGTEYTDAEEVSPEEITAVRAQLTYDIPEAVRKEYNLAKGMKATIDCVITNVTPDYKISLKEAYFNVSATATFTCNVSLDVLEAIGVAPSIELVRVPVGVVGYMSASLELTLKGNITLTLVENISAGVQYKNGSLRLVSDFHKQAFTIQAQAEASAGIKLTAGFDVVALKGSIYGRIGAKATIQMQTYDDGKTPTRCTHMQAYMYASVGADVKVDLVVWKKSWSKTYEIYGAGNSPVRVVFHYEDGTAVPKCTRDGSEDGNPGSGGGTSPAKKWKYYTPASSRYGYNGASGGVDANGNEYSIFEYSLDDAKNATITKYQGNVSALSIPDTLDGYPVVGIAASVFKNNKQLRVVVIPDSVTKIDNNAFAACSNLITIILSKNITSIGEHAFNNCSALTSIEIPKSLEKTGTSVYGKADNGIFVGCNNLKNITFEEGTTRIANSLFANCAGIEQMTIPATVTEIQQEAFYGCKNLQRIIIPNSVTNIGSNAFAADSLLKEVIIPNSVTNIGSNAFAADSLLKEVIIPDSVTKIDNNAFAGCSNLERVILSKNITSIGEHAFNNCSALTSIEIPKSLEKTGTSVYGKADNGIFVGCNNLKNITFEEGTTRIANSLFANCAGIEQMTIPATVTEIQQEAFYGCKNLQRIIIPNSVTNIGSNAFAADSLLKEVIIPDSVTKIDNNAFAGCSNLERVILSKNITSIGEHAFNNCSALTSIEIPKSLEKTGTSVYGKADNGIFVGCNNLKNITFEEGTTRIANSLFANCAGIEQMTIPATVTEIQQEAFYGCKNLQRIIIPNSVTSIGSNAFAADNSLKEVMLPNSITDMGTYIFSGCTSLQKVHIPEGRKNITEGTFQNCTSLQSIELPDGLQYIRKYAFKGSGLTEITIPDSVIEIEDSAFRECANLSKVTLGERVKTLGQYTFYKCPVLSGMALPDSLTTMGIYCFAECDKLVAVTFGTGLTKIPSYAFNLCQSLTKIELPYRLQTVDANAFTNCTSLTEVTIPRNTGSIASNAFSYPTKMTVYGIAGTYAETYAKSVGAKFVNKEVKATKVQLSETNLSINKGETTTLILTVTPQNFTDEVTWKSSNTNVVTISDTGVVTAKAAGTATIRVTVGTVNASCKVTVLQPVTSISLNKYSLTLEGGDSFTLVASVYPSDAYNKQVKWSTSDERVASVDQQGNVTATGKGKATITAMAADGSGVYRNCTVTVNSITTKVTDIKNFASEHPYENNCSDSWIYTKQGASKLEVTFSKETEVEDEFDFLYIYDQDGKEVGKYTGTRLAGQSITVNGNTVKVKLVSDGQGTAYGFCVTQVKEVVESTPTQPVEEKFTDVQQGAWYVSAVQYAYDNGIMGGKSETIFAPEANLTRAEFATVLYSQSGKPSVTYRPVFKDVEEGAWYSNPVLWAYDNGIVSGYANGNFGTSDNITREQLALMMYKYAKTKGYDTTAESGMLQKFSDEAQISTWAREAIQWAASHGIMSGKGNGADGKPLLDPQGNATRAECAAMMKKMLTMN